MSTAPIARPRLVEALIEARDKRVVLLEAPPGYGKTTLVTEWLASERERRRFARLALTPMDADPERLLGHLVAALEERLPAVGAFVGIDPDRPARASAPIEPAVAQLLDGLAAARERLLIVLDDYHHLRDRPAHDLLDLFVTGLPPTVQLVVVTRAHPRLPLARLRAGGALLELRATDLRLDEGEAARLLAAFGVVEPRPALSDLVERTEGWPAGLALAARALPTESDPAGFVARFTGTRREVADYFCEEVLRQLPPSLRSFLVRTSILRRMCGRLCDALLDDSGGQGVLEQLDRSNLFVVPLDAERRWYRYHRLFGEVLRAELRRTRPGLTAELHRRASAWFDAAGKHEEAADHALAALRLTPSRPAGETSIDLDEAGEVVFARVGGCEQFTHRVDRGLAFGQRLTDRELTILRLLSTQLSRREIASELFLSVNTVKTHSQTIYRKLGVSSRREATERARELALLEPNRAPLAS